MATQGGRGGPVDLAQLHLMELEKLKSQVEQECSLLTNSVNQLKAIQQKLNNSKECLVSFKPESEDKQLLVPLTSSMYAPGLLKDSNKVIVDIGTGYYVEKSIAEADAFFKRRIQHVNVQIEKIEGVLTEKRKLLEAVMMVHQAKIQMLAGSMQSNAGVMKRIPGKV